MPTILLVRHATTPTTGVRLYGRKPGVHISDKGIAQAEAAAVHLADTKVAAVYCSPLERTRETAAIVAKPHGLKPKVRAGLNEVEYGEWTDRTLASLRKLKAWTTIQQTPSRFAFPGGESLRAAQARFVDAVEAIAEDHTAKEVVVVVSHADLIRMAITHFTGAPLDAFQRVMVSPASITTIHLSPGAQPMVVATNVVPRPPRTPDV